MKTKRFSPKLYKANDLKAKRAVKKLFKGTKYTIKENKNRYEVDLLVFNSKKEHVFNIEAEIRHNWNTTKKFPFDTIRIPYRKLKYLQLDKPTIFVSFNKDLTAYAAMRDNDILESPVKVVPNRYVKAGEKFFVIDLKNVQFNNLKGLL
jgi:hypothetical protein